MAEVNTATSTTVLETAQQTGAANAQTQQTGATQQNSAQPPKNTEPDKKYSDEDVDKIISQKFADWQKKKDAEIDEAKKLAEMNEAQKAKYETEKLQKQLDELLQKNTLSEMTKTARSILSEDGISISDDLLSVMVSTDAEKTNTAVESFKKLFKDSVDKAVKEALKGNPPKTGTTKPGTMTKEQIMGIKDPVERQKIMLQNKDLFGL